jgi:hypothetical protein
MLIKFWQEFAVPCLKIALSLRVTTTQSFQQGEPLSMHRSLVELIGQVLGYFRLF